MKILIVATVSLMLSGCPGKKIESEQGGPEPGTPTAPEPAEPPRPCEDILRDMEQSVTGGSSSCAKDEDCGCFDEQYDTGKCGVVTSKGSVENVEKFAAEARNAGCELPKPCPGFECKPHCRLRGGFDGFCTQLTMCIELSEKFEKVLSEGSIACESDEDCGTYRAGVGINCGGVIGKKTADKLAEIAEEFFEIGCSYAVQCAPRASFHGVCKSNVCMEVPDF